MNKIMIERDPGIDDALVRMRAADSPGLDILAVTTVAGNRPVATTARNARQIMDLVGRPDIPVYAGAVRPPGLSRGALQSGAR